MSRQQWGHGYYSGIKDFKNGKHLKNKYVFKLNEDGLILDAFMIWGQADNKYVLESLRDILFNFHLSGFTYELSEDEKDIDLEEVCEMTIDELSEFHEPKFCINCKAFWGFVIQNAKRSDEIAKKRAKKLQITVDDYYELTEDELREMEANIETNKTETVAD